MSEDPRKVVARLRTATLPRRADVMTVCDELESRLSTVGLQSPPLFSTKAVVSTECPVCAGRREAKRRATTWSSGPGHWALRSTTRYAASLTVMGDRFKRVE